MKHIWNKSYETHMIWPISCSISVAYQMFQFEWSDVAFLDQSNQSFHWSKLLVKCLDPKSFILALQKYVFNP